MKQVNRIEAVNRGYESTFEERLERDNTKTTHTKNLGKFLIEVYKSFIHLNPEYMWDFLRKKRCSI